MTLNEFLDSMEDKDSDRYLRLQPGEVKCDRCDGSGDDFNRVNHEGYHISCKKCHGNGKVNWLEDILWVKS